MSNGRKKPGFSGARESSMIDDARQQFRHAWRPPRPPHVIRVDEAVDAIGLALFRDRWGKQPEFDKLPIFAYGGRLLRLESKKPPRYEKVAVEPTEVVSSVASDFKQAFTLLRRALRSSVRATYVGTYGSQHALRKPLLYTQGINIFGAGHVKLGKKRVTVWIDKKDFEYWFKSTLVPRKNVSPEAKLIFHKVVTAFLVECASIF